MTSSWRQSKGFADDPHDLVASRAVPLVRDVPAQGDVQDRRELDNAFDRKSQRFRPLGLTDDQGCRIMPTLFTNSVCSRYDLALATA